MGTATLRPDGDVAINQGGGQNWGLTGGATHNAVLNDNSDATYDQVPAGAGSAYNIVSLGTFAFPQLSQIRSVAVRLRAQLAAPSVANHVLHVRQRLADGTEGDDNTWQPQSPLGGFGNFTMPAAVLTPKAAAWTQADIDSLLVRYYTTNTGGSANALTLLELYVDVLYNEAPVVANTTPATGGQAPTATWTYVDPEGDVQERYRVKVFSGSALVADPEGEVTRLVYDSGEVYSAATLHTLTKQLGVGSYVVAVKAADLGSSGRYSLWSTSALTVSVDQPAAPKIERVQAQNAGLWTGNLLSPNQASAETDLTGLTAYGAATLDRSDAISEHGLYSAKVTTTGAGQAGVRVAATGGAGLIHVVPGTTYTAVARVRTDSAARAASMLLRFFSVTGVQVGADQLGAAINEQPGGWVSPYVTAVAPAGADYVELRPAVTALGAAEVHYVDTIGLAAGTYAQLTRDPLQAVGLLVDGRQNLAREQASALVDLNSSVDGWGQGSVLNATVLNPSLIGTVTSQPQRNAITIRSVAAGNAYATLAPIGDNAGNPQGFPVQGGRTITVGACVRAATVARSVSMVIHQYDAALAFLGETTGPQVTDQVDAWSTEVRQTLKLATNCAYVRFGVVIYATGAANEDHYVTRAFMRYGVANELRAGEPNRVPDNVSSAETSAAGWVNDINAAIAQSAAQAKVGTKSVSVTAIGATGPAVEAMGALGCFAANDHILVVPGAYYDFTIAVRAAATARSARARIDFYTLGGGYLVSIRGATAVELATGWTDVTVRGQAPWNAGYATIVAEWTQVAAGEVHYIDDARVSRVDPDPSFESGLGQLELPGGSTAAPATREKVTGAAQGDYVLLCASTSAAAAAAYRIGPTERWAAGVTYYGQARFRARTVGRNCQIYVVLHDANGAQQYASAVAQAFDTTTGWTTITTAGVVSDANTRGIRLVVQIDSQPVGEIHEIDGVVISAGEPPGAWVAPEHWTRGGLVGGDNALPTANDASFETGLGSWVADVSFVPATTLGRNAQGWTLPGYPTGVGGTWAALLTNTAVAGERRAFGPKVAVTAGRRYSASARFSILADAARSVRLLLQWFDVDGNLLNTTTGQNMAETASAAQPVIASVTAVAPAGATALIVVADVLAMGVSTQLFDMVQAGWGWSDRFVLPGVPRHRVQLERSINGGATWTTVKQLFDATGAALVSLGGIVLDEDQRVAVYDQEAPRDVPVLYRATSLAGVDTTTTYTSSPGALSDAVTITPDRLSYLKSPTNPALSMVFCHEDIAFESTSSEDITVFEPRGRATPVIFGGTIRAEAMSLKVACASDAEWDAFEALRRRQEVLLFQSAFGDTGKDQFYVRLGPDRRVVRVTSDRMELAQIRHVTVAAREVAAPA